MDRGTLPDATMPVVASTEESAVITQAQEEEQERRLVEEMLRQIASLKRRRNASRGVMLDVDLDGVRCVILGSTGRGDQRLTPREREIAGHVARGRSNKEIGSELAISSWTVAGYLRRIFAKLDVSSRAEMVARLLAP